MKVLAIVRYVFLLVGVGLLTGTYFFYQNTATFLGKAIAADGVVVDLRRSRSSSSSSSSYYPVVDFTARTGGQVEFESSVGSNPPSYSTGEHVSVLYLPDNPQNARIKSFFSLWGGVAITGGLGLVFFLIGAGMVLVPRAAARREAYLRSQGVSIDTAFQSVQLNESLSVNGRHPYVVMTQWQDPSTSKVHVFKSGNVWFDPTSYISNDTIKVFIERNNPSKYVVDLSFLPETAG